MMQRWCSKFRSFAALSSFQAPNQASFTHSSRRLLHLTPHPITNTRIQSDVFFSRVGHSFNAPNTLQLDQYGYGSSLLPHSNVLKQFGGGYGGSDNVVDEAQLQQHQKLEKLYISTRTSKHFQRDIVRGVEGYIVTGSKQVEIGTKLSEDSRKYGSENTCTSGNTLSRAAANFARARAQMEKERGNLIKALSTQVAEPLRAMVMGAPLVDARHLAQRYDRMRQEAEAQRVIQSGLGANLTKWRGFNASNVSAAAANSAEAFRFNRSSMYLKSYLSSNRYDGRYDRRNISQLVKQTGKRLFLVDTLAVVRKLEAQGIPSKQAEAITTAITEVLNDSLENVAESFVTKTDMQKSEMLQDANLAKFKSEVQNSQEHHFSMLQRETEKLKSDIDKIRSELRYEIDKVTAGQRLDLNLERGRIRDELANQNAETTNLTNKLDREIHGLRAQLEAAKYEVIKYCIGTLVSISAVGLAVLRILL